MPIAVTHVIPPKKTKSRHKGSGPKLIHIGVEHLGAKAAAHRTVSRVASLIHAYGKITHVRATHPPKPRKAARTGSSSNTSGHVVAHAPRSTAGISPTLPMPGSHTPVSPVVMVNPAYVRAQNPDLNDLGGSHNKTAFEIGQEANQALQQHNLAAAVAGGQQVPAALLNRFSVSPSGAITGPIHKTSSSSSTRRSTHAGVTHARTHSSSSRTSGTHVTHPHKPPKPPRPPLQLTDAGLLGHTDHAVPVTHAPLVAPITTRHPR